jgi:AcrR family transcriptional regulator
MPRKRNPDRRRQILDAAKKLFGTRGYQATNIAAIAAELEIGHGTFYRYFKNKRDIFAQVLAEIMEQIGAIAITEDPNGSDTLDEFREQVERIGMALFDILANPTVANLVFHEAYSVDSEMRERIEQAFDFFARFTNAYLDNGKAKGFLRSDFDTAIAARAMNAIVFEAVRRLAGADDPEAHVQGWVDVVMMLQFEGLAAKS